jgi:hypothetical protein
MTGLACLSGPGLSGSTSANCENDAMGQFPTHAPQQVPTLFDHLVGEGEQLIRHGEAENPRGLVIDD